ncbi:hypothetical protein COU58_03845 [Candidatus Pacearchaeota archaeon CG10_big_fil_rev_8_21_14_0_10_32_42]|nr:MAG: hypothetical protein COU58_03845 [Candidatus Pacearchaeota archaeon CG10_big_fil_rev_8_21_14_0_10_32_42]
MDNFIRFYPLRQSHFFSWNKLNIFLIVKIPEEKGELLVRKYLIKLNFSSEKAFKFYKNIGKAIDNILIFPVGKKFLLTF